MIEGLYIHRTKPVRLHQLGKNIWGNLNNKNRVVLTKAGAHTEARLKELDWLKVGGKVMVMWND